jgi:hypothetical protein
VFVALSRSQKGDDMQNAPSASPEQIMPFGIVGAVLVVAVVAIALIWWMKKTRGGVKPPNSRP